MHYTSPKTSAWGNGVRAGAWRRAWSVEPVDRRRSPGVQAALCVAEPGVADTSPGGSLSGHSMVPLVCLVGSRKLELPQTLGAIEDQSDPASIAKDPEREPAAACLDVCRYEDQRVDEAAEIHREELRAAGAPRQE